MHNQLQQVDLNCDMGEGMLSDADIMPFISSTNIACGFHAGDEAIMKRTIELAIQHKVSIGAHPGYNDKQNFGRTAQHLTDEQYYDLIIQQLEIIDNICIRSGTRLHHVKPHGALYNTSAKDKTVAAIIAKAVKNFNSDLLLFGLSNSFSISEAKAIGLKTVNEVFADRTYQDNGSLTPRSDENALITDTSLAIEQVLQMITTQSVTSINKNKIAINAGSICLHGDGAHAVDFVKQIHSTLVKNAISIKTPQ
jgi:UPF0271 protein